MANIKLTIAYDGSNYRGWQRQPQGPTVQGVVEDKLALICEERVTLYGAGRTDARVHAWGQVANFHTQCCFEPPVWQRVLNSVLPRDIVIRQAEAVEDSFHARYAARKKHYRYRLLLSPERWPFEENYAWHLPYCLDVKNMQEAAACLLGEHDFSAFAAAGSEVKTNTRRLESLGVEPHGKILQIELVASGFLRHMARNIVGTLVEVGRGKLAAGGLPQILAGRDRSQAGPTAPAQGLYLIAVGY